MKISDDQNTITLDDGTILVAAPMPTCGSACKVCHFDATLNCDDIPCAYWERTDNDNVIFIQKV